MHRPGERRISCKRCQTRKIKCSRTSPCRSCSAAGVKCEFRADDWKRSPISPEYAAALESRIAALECLLSSIKTSSGYDRESVINGIDFLDHYPSNAKPSQVDVEYRHVSSIGLCGYWGFDEEASTAVFHAPGSAYATGFFRPFARAPETCSQSPFTMEIGRCPAIVLKECIGLFFRCQRPFCAILNRDEFEQGVFTAHKGAENRSKSLLHAVCALGALMSDDDHIRELAKPFAVSAERIISEGPFWHSCMETAQAMLLVAVYATGRGNISKAWMYSGMAFRMTQDLGIHENFSSNFLPGSQSALSADADLRRRMSLTMIISDKFLSLLYGRVPLLSCQHIDPVAPLSDYTTSHSEAESPQQYEPFISTILLTKQAELAQIIQEIQSQVHNNRNLHCASGHWLEATYTKLNAKLWSWHDSLPGEMRWNRWSSSLEEVDPGHADLHMMYHTARLSLHRPLIGRDFSMPAPPHGSRITLSASEYCEASIETIAGIFRRFNAQHSLRNASLSFVHGAVAAADGVLALAEASPAMRHTYLPTLDAALLDMAQTWAIAANARHGLQQVVLELHLPSQPSPQEPERRFSRSHGRTSLCAEYPPTIPDATVSHDFSSWQSEQIQVLSLPPLDVELLGHGNVEAGMFASSADSDRNFWTSIALDGEVSSSYTGSQVSSSAFYGP